MFIVKHKTDAETERSSFTLMEEEDIREGFFVSQSDGERMRVICRMVDLAMYLLVSWCLP